MLKRFAGFLIFGVLLGVSCTKEEAPVSVRSENEVKILSGDGETVYGDYYPVQRNAKGLVLLFHQANSNAGEYEPIARRLNEMGYSALALDLRSGGDRWGRRNRTVVEIGRSTSYEEAYPDMVAALKYAKSLGMKEIWVWGSSYSASLALRLASEYGEDIRALCLFSPGEYFGSGDRVKSWAKGVRVPVLALCPDGESSVVSQILSACASSLKVLEVRRHAVHGASTLREDRNPLGWEEGWRAVHAFMEKVDRIKDAEGGGASGQ